MQHKLNILIVDDHPVVLEGMTNILQQLSCINHVHKSVDALSAMLVLKEDEIQVVITDINLPEINGIELCKRIKLEFPSVKVIGMSTFHDPMYVGEMLQAGGKGFITKNSTIQEIETAITAVCRGEVIISHLLDNQKAITFKKGDGPVITRREKEVLQLIAEGLTNKEIAEKLFVSISTVDSHRKNLLSKFEVTNAASLITKATKSGII
jgi:DNA-binding NarL/FixJ family response regulator